MTDAPLTTKPPLPLSRRVRSVPEALSIYVNQLVYDQKRKGKDVTTLSLGEAFFDIPMFEFTKLDFVKGYHYSDSQGLPELRQRIAEFYAEQYGARFDADENVLITAGSKPILYFAMLACVEPGEEILIHEPGWLSYPEQARLVGATPRFIPWSTPVEAFGEHFTDRTRMLVINNPNNPAGRLYEEHELRCLYELCRSRGIYLLVDEAYSDFVMGQRFVSLANVVPDLDGAIVVNSLSKNMGMSGWRVGYAITHPTLIAALLRINQHVITCAPTVLQSYMAKYFRQVTDVTLPQVRDIVEKRERVARDMDRLGLKRLAGSCTFYFMVSIGDFPGTSLDLTLELLLNHQISVVPGTAYGDSTARFVRVGVGAESEERIHDALLVLRDLIHRREYDPAPARARLRAEGFHAFEEARA